MSSINSYIDGNWIDICTLISGFLTLAYFQLARKIAWLPQPLASKKSIDVFLSGATLFPFIILAASVLSSQLLNELLGASKVTLALAGVVATMNVLKNLFQR